MLQVYEIQEEGASTREPNIQELGAGGKAHPNVINKCLY